MPTYDYVCAACEHAFEAFHSITAKPLRKCPQCGKLKLKKLIGTGAGVIFKGSGFYETDYRSDSYKKAAKADTATPAASESTSKSDTPSSSTPAATSSSDSSPSKKSETKSAEKKSATKSKD